jgi:hypothetical protein
MPRLTAPLLLLCVACSAPSPKGARDAEETDVSAETDVPPVEETDVPLVEDTDVPPVEETDPPAEDTEPEEGSPAPCTPEPFPPAWTDDDGYQRFTLCGWTVHMADALVADDLGAEVYVALGRDLNRVLEVLPADTIPVLRGTHLWLELDVPAFPGGVYHPSAQWLQDNGYPTRWAGGVQLGNAANYLSWVAQQPAMVLHELAHAWDHGQHGYAQPAVLAAYDAAMAAGIYDAVAYVGGQTLEAYATTNAAEYFAELSEAWFWMNDYQPFVRAELQTHDPVGAAAVEEAWGLR